MAGRPGGIAKSRKSVCLLSDGSPLGEKLVHVDVLKGH
jgi:hypothetical protein